MLEDSNLQSIILTSKLAEAEVFYADVLGLPLITQSDGALVFSVGGSDLRVSPVATTKPTEHTVLGFAVSDVTAIVGALRDKGVVLERFAWLTHDDSGIFTTPEGSKVAWFRDPDGNLLSVVQYQRTDQQRL